MIQSSIIIVSFNGKRYLCDCLTSIYARPEGDFEVILVDNASSDGSLEEVRDRFPQVSVVPNPRNTGFAAACNQGAGLARGKYLVFLNQDTRVCPGWLAGLLAPLDEDPATGLATSKLLLMSDPERIQTCGQDIHYSGLAFARGFWQSAAGWDRAGRVAAVSGASFAIRRELWERLGGFDERLNMYYEETDLSWRAWQAGYASVFAPQSIAFHDGKLRPSANAMFFSARNRCILLLKHWRTATLALLTPGLLLAELVEWGVMLLYGWDGIAAKVRAGAWLLGHFDLLISARKSRQPRPGKPDWYILEQFSPCLRPVVLTGGKVGKGLTAFLNGLLWVNYQVALFIGKLLNI